MASRRHLVAVNRMIRLLPDGKVAVMGAFVELARDLARSMDAKAGSVTPALASSYRGVLKDLEHAIQDAAGDVKRGREGVEEPEPDLPLDAETDAVGGVEDIDEWRRNRAGS